MDPGFWGEQCRDSLMESVEIDSAGLIPAFSLTAGGPGTALMKRLHVVHPELNAGSVRTALILVALTWLPMSVLCLLEGLAFSGARIPFLYDIAAYARFLFAIPVLILADIPLGVRFRELVRHFVAAHLVRNDEMAKFRECILDALRFRDSRFAELMLLVLAYIATYGAIWAFLFQSGSTWFRPLPGRGLSPVGYWYAFVALPIFQFLILR